MALAAHRPWWDDDLAHMNPLPPAVLAQDRQLRQAPNAPEVGSLLVASGATREEVLEMAESLRPAARARWQAAGDIGGFTLVSDYPPSAAAQTRRRAALPEAPRLRSNSMRHSQGCLFAPTRSSRSCGTSNKRGRANR
mgnify:CR=1 FL=1